MLPVFPRFYIADIHGSARELRCLLTFITDFCYDNNIAPQVTFLGDYVDRGPMSMQVLEIVCRTLKTWPGSKALRGNHDDLFLDNLASGSTHKGSDNWLYVEGGVETLTSYTSHTSKSVIYPFIRSSYEHHVDLLESLHLSSMDGPFFACHAGVDRTRPLDKQTAFDLTWIRDEFQDFVDPTAVPVIHGHEPMMHGLPEVTENRISLDTGAFATGKLTACFVDDRIQALRFFQATNKDVAEVKPFLKDRGYGTVMDRLPALFGAMAAA